ncbi:MAG: pitrilysin family protein [Deltaproteobacteria bacterium]|nr:pitrilysin family protein [Deltaproteobacteria bacterium]
MKPKLHTLSNGMQVVLEENHVAPVLSFNALVKVGSADETDAEAGISHLIEHMLFKGTKRRKVGDIARDVEAAGGEINAYTSFDQTVYYINMAKRFGDKGLDILADAIQNPTFDATELEREKEVVLEEIRRERDNPSRHVGEILFQKAYQQHTYGRPIIGFDATVKAISQEILFGYYRRWYIPQNTVFIVVGDFESAEMLQKIENAFGAWTGESKIPLQQKRIVETPQLKTVFEIQPDKIQSVYFGLGFHIPDITHADVPALDILSHVLGGAESSRLEQILKEKKRLVQSIHSYAYTPRDPGLMILGGHLNVSQASAAFACLWEEIDKLKNEGPTPEELRRAKLNIRATEIYEKETVGGQAGKLAYFLATARQLDFEEKYYQRLQTVTCEEVMQAAQRYLLHTNQTAALLVPEKDYGKSWVSKVSQTLQHPSLSKKVRETEKKGLVPKTTRLLMLANGIKLILREDHSLPIVSICCASLGGLRVETPSDNGINHLLAQCLVKGTGKHSALEITQATEAMAGSLDGFSGKNSIGLKAEFLSDYLEEGLDLFFEVLLEPAWDAKEMAKEKRLTLEAIKNQEDALSSLAFLHFQKSLFPTHPYGMRTYGSKQSVAKLNPAKIKNYYRKLLTCKNLVLSLVGDFSSEEIVAVIREKLKGIPKKGTPFKKHKIDPKPQSIKKVVINKDKQQAHVVLGFAGSTVGSPDHPALTMLSNILSGQGGRLFLELRDKLSLAYSVTAILQEGVDPGYFAVYIGTDPSKVPTAIDGMKKELEKISTELVTEEELERTKNYLVGTYELELQKNTSLAQAYAFNELYGLSFKDVARYPEKILKVTRADILRVAKKYIDLKAYVLSIVEPKKN